MTDDTRVDIYVKRIKNNKWLSIAVSTGVVFLALVSFAKGLQEAGTILGKAFSTSNLESQYDAATKEALISVARDIDLFFLSIEASPDSITSSTMEPTYLKIKADLRSVFLRNKVRPLNDAAINQSEILLDQWSIVGKILQMEIRSTRERHSRPNGIRKPMQIARQIMFEAFSATLSLEEAKKKSDK